MKWIAAALLLASASCMGGERPVRPNHDRPTIVSLNPCTDAILAEVTEPGQLLAISHYSKDPRASSMEADKAARFAVTGGTVEEILALDPDLVVASSFIAPATRAALDDLGIRVATFGAVSSVEDSLAQVRELAELAGGERAGQTLAAEIETALVRSRSDDGAAVEGVLWQPGGIVPGEAALVSDLLRHAGFASYSEERGLQQADYLSLEQIVADPPDVLLIAGSEAGQKHPVLADLPKMQRETFDTRLIYCGGPTIIRALERLVKIRQRAS